MEFDVWIGPASGLSAALVWAFASVLWARVPLPAASLTTFKNVMAAVLMGLVLVLASRLADQPILEASLRQWKLLSISGLIGLVVGDIAFFRSLQILGARRGLTLTLLTPPVTSLLGWCMLHESIVPAEWAAMLVTMIGLGVVMWDRASGESKGMRTAELAMGLFCSAVGILCQALGSILMKLGTGDQADGLRTIEATFLRMVAAALLSFALTSWAGKWREIGQLLRERRPSIELVTAAFLGTFVGVWLMLTAFKYSRAGVASTLTSTSPLFVIPIVWLFLGERVSKSAMMGRRWRLAAFAGWYWGWVEYGAKQSLVDSAGADLPFVLGRWSGSGPSGSVADVKTHTKSQNSWRIR